MKLKNKNYKILFVCHDAGSGNIILNYIDKFLDKKINYDLLVSGPSKKLCITHHKDLKFNNFNIDFNYPYKFVITGTSLYSMFEHNIRQKFLLKKRKVIAIVDHWVNIEKRFIKNKKTVLPTDIWCLDIKTKKIIQQIFSKIKIKIIKNYFLETQTKKLNLKTKNKNCVLYLSEPIKFRYRNKVIDETYLLSYFLKNIYKLNIKKPKIILKIHPKENENKYNQWISINKKFNIVIDYHNDLSTLINLSNIIVGFQTSALLLALKTNKLVFTSNPFPEKKIRIDDKKLFNFY